ncbi:nucleotidyl transferase AbiEii/AbiGii toxin family protein [Streptomyces sp. NBC_00439]|uniref:nucleotidyl transferase AbiEii/AbiGii toxin family protein n=1 Tax=Streptomyces sp. NBC_00439 TaxID=2903650 RepID=UPI002259A62F|nr:nucleotidyl transferase AbiEii/AbiGii toxin family protein [Streptomyces sp. NBC_00439]MCX5103885.1 nucleotidyl transferase AbiEii/AbiGii toxin family protein [Streptomyces sp. NBC_00439]
MTSSADGSASWRRLWAGTPHVPHVPLDEETRRSSELPGTLLPAPAGMNHPLIFEPALKQFANAYRAGEPVFGDGRDDVGRAWHRARRTVLDTVLASIAGGPWGGHLVLRGSVLMATWFGEAARDPGDLDFLFVPQDWAMDDPRSAGLFETIARDAAEAASAARGSVRINAAGLVTEDIWTYDRVPGRRMLLPWTADGVPGGTVQLDMVFNETLPSPAVLTELQPLGDGPGCRVQAVSPELSLAWKLLWLVTDAYPQGKDLYDAVLLAERTPPGYELVREAFVLGGTEGLRPPGAWWLYEFGVPTDWEHFTAEYPWVTKSAASYCGRLAQALAPLLEAAERPYGADATHATHVTDEAYAVDAAYGIDEVDSEVSGRYRLWARWLEPLVKSTLTAAPEGPAAALGFLAEGGQDGLTAAVVVVREIAGPRHLGLADALAAVLSHEGGWGYWREHPEACERALDDLR